MILAKLAFNMGRRIGKHPIAGALFCRVERFLPLNRITRTNNLVVFHHPRPIAVPHVLIVPTHPVASLLTPAINDVQRAQLVWQMIELGRETTMLLPPSDRWQLVINGGKRQEIGQVHAHLIHAETDRDEGIALANPQVEPDPWRELFAIVRKADQAPEPAYTLTIRWVGQLNPVAEVIDSNRA